MNTLKIDAARMTSSTDLKEFSSNNSIENDTPNTDAVNEFNSALEGKQGQTEDRILNTAQDAQKRKMDDTAQSQTEYSLPDKGRQSLRAEGKSPLFTQPQSDDSMDKKLAADKDLLDNTSSQCLSGDAVLSSLFGNRMLQQVKTPVEPAVDTPSIDLESLASTVADRILVSDPKLSGMAEVRIMINDAYLQNTELHLTRDADGMLTVTMLTSDTATHQTLVAAQDVLKNRLEQQENIPVRIDISQHSDAENGDMRRRSRGLEYSMEKNA